MSNPRLPWVAAGSSSRTDLDCTSSTSVLQSIYGSQASQLHFTDSESEQIDEDVYSIHRQRRPSVMRRPKSAILSREQRTRENQLTSENTLPQPSVRKQYSRPASAVTQFVSPSSSGARRQYSRPASAIPSSSRSTLPSTTRSSVQRPATATYRRRPSSGLVRPSSASSMNLSNSTSSVQLVRDTAPVSVSSTPQYFGFWNEKPLLRKEFVTPVHRRKNWRRPRSAIWSSSIDRGKGSGADDTGKGRLGGENETGLLSALDELDGSLGDSQGRKNGISGEENDEDGLGKNGKRGDGLGDDQGSGNENDLNNGGDSKGEKDRWNKYGDGSGWSNLYDQNEFDNDREKNGHGRGGYGDGDGYGDGFGGEGDEYFKKLKGNLGSSWMDSTGTLSNTTRFSLPVDLLTLERMTPTDYLHSHCVISFRRTSYYNKVFKRTDRDKDGRISLVELLDGLSAAHYNCLKSDQAHNVAKLMALEDGVAVDKHLFGAACVLAERLFPECLPSALKKELIEAADFQALDWKLRTCTLPEPLLKLLSKL